MKMIKPIVNISKIMENYDVIIVGLGGVLSDGAEIRPEALTTLINLRKAGKKIVLLTNSSQRLVTIAKFLQQNQVPLALFESIISAGEILHYKFKVQSGDFAAIGLTYYKVGSQQDNGMFAGLDYLQTANPANADFLYMDAVAGKDDLIDQYIPLLEHAASLGIPFVCAGNDTSCFQNGKICLAAGALAEQYAVLGGRIITLGKPDLQIFNYCLDGLAKVNKENVLMIGDNLNTDIKGANLFGIDSVLLSKGVHVNYLGEGYIPDVAKTRELSNNFDAIPDYVMSNLRW